MAVATRGDFLLRHRQLLAAGHADLPLDEIDAGDHFAHRVLHLQTRVHLEEEELAVLIDEFDRAGVEVTNGLGCLHGGFAHCIFHAIGQRRSRSLFDELLVTTLRRTVARGDPHVIAVHVTHQLHFDVARPGEVLLDVDLVASEERLGLALRAVHRVLHFGGAAHDLHTATATTERGLDGHRPAVLVAELGDLGRGGHEFGGARNDGGAASQSGLAARNLVTHFANRVGGRSDESDSHLRDGVGEVGVLGEESVTRVNAVGAALADGVEDGLGVQVALGGRLPTQGVGLVGQAHVQGVAVELGVDGHGGDAHLAGGADHAHGDLTAVRNEDFRQRFGGHFGGHK